MKTLAFAAALLTASAAFAQQPTTGNNMPQPTTQDQATQTDTNAPADQSAQPDTTSTTTTTTTNSWNSSGTAASPPPAQGTATWPTMNNPVPAQGPYPRCSRTVTDRCQQRR